MGKIKVAMLEEGDYVSGFATYVWKHGESWMELHCFTGTDNLKRYMSDGKPDVLLIGEKYISEFQMTEQVQKVIVLSEDGHAGEGLRYPVVFKYQSAASLLKDVCGEIASGDGIPDVSAGIRVCDKEFIGVFSPWGGCGSMSYAQMLCENIKNGRSVLYVNLHLLSAMPVNGRDKSDALKKKSGMSELLYYIRQGKENAALKMRSIVREFMGIESIYPVEDYRDLYGMSEDDAWKFLSLLSHDNAYDAVVFDIGYLSETSLLFLQQCDRVYLPEASCETERTCLQSFNDLLVKDGMEELTASFITVKMGTGGENA